jgi:hypothetical protein
MMVKKRTSTKGWQGKLQDSGVPVVKKLPVNIAGMKAGQIMLVPTPQLIDAFMREIPEGQVVEVKTMRADLALRHNAEVTCPITTGFHVRTVAEAAYEQYLMGATLKEITPFWRVIGVSTPTAAKLVCGLQWLRERRLAEGLPA